VRDGTVTLPFAYHPGGGLQTAVGVQVQKITGSHQGVRAAISACTSDSVVDQFATNRAASRSGGPGIR